MKIIDINKNPDEAKTLALKELRKGNLIIYPTETCYGLGADTTNSDAIEKLFAYKGNRKNQVAIAVSSQKMSKLYVYHNEIAQNIYNNLLPGPITVVSKSKGLVIKRLESTHHTLGIRIPDYKWTLDLISSYNKPITTTSANTSGKKQPYSLADWKKYTSVNKQKMISLFLNAGKLKNRPTSTIVDTTLNEPEILRQGEITLDELKHPPFISNSDSETISHAIDLFNKHYTPNKLLIVALQGDLGTGKTQFSKGIGKYLSIKEEITSPTYTIMREYTHKHGVFYHIDTWRLEDSKELSSLITSKMLNSGNVIAFEWVQKANEMLEHLAESSNILWVTIKELTDHSRTISHKFVGDKS